MTFDESAQQGAHRELAAMAGSFRGRMRTWFEPGTLAEEVDIEGSLELILGGRFLLHRYRTTMMGKPAEGLAIHGYHLQLGRWETAWVDSFHTGTMLMYSTGTGPGLSVTGSYPAQEGPDWGWRTELERAPEGLIIRHHNVPPGGEPALAVEIVYRRT